MSKNKKNKKKNIFKIINLGIWILSIITTTILGYFIVSANVLPFKYLIMIIIILLLLLAIHGLLVFRKTKNWILIIKLLF